jgi:N-ethylmaleimide reductase
MAEYYSQRASAALCISEAVAVSPTASAYPRTPGIYNEEQIQGWRIVTHAVHREGGRLVAQLWHCGRVAHTSVLEDNRPIAPSPIAAQGLIETHSGPLPFSVPREMTHDDIRAAINSFSDATAAARLAGCDGVEIHAANGYLIDQFLRDGSNLRRDRYGGSPERRIRFLLEVVEACCLRWTSRRIGLRISPNSTLNGMTDALPAITFGKLLAALNSFDLAYVHIIEATKGYMVQEPLRSPLFREFYEGSIILNGGYTRERAEEALSKRYGDAISFGSGFIANPDLPRRLKERLPLQAADPKTLYSHSSRGYTDYPTVQ